jgi:protein-L-isoaspartate(D-aspartate) O-methyltransferase
LVSSVYSIEIVKSLANEAKQRLKSLDYHNVHVRHGDGYQGWPEHAPFDLIIVAAAPNHVPAPLIEQLAIGGTLVIPVGERFSQNLIVLKKQPDGSVKRTVVAPVAFVPMTGDSIDNR